MIHEHRHWPNLVMTITQCNSSTLVSRPFVQSVSEGIAEGIFFTCEKFASCQIMNIVIDHDGDVMAQFANAYRND